MNQIYKPISAQKFRIALKPHQYELLKTALVSHMHHCNLDFAAQAPFMELFVAIDKMIQSIPHRIPDSALLADEAKRNVPVNAATLGFNDDEIKAVESMSTQAQEDYWKKIEEAIDSDNKS